jgi:hypothetical protein
MIGNALAFIFIFIVLLVLSDLVSTIFGGR